MSLPSAQSVFIATPTLDGSLDCRYVAALLHSTAALTRRGITFEICFEVGNSLIPDARNKLVAKFLASRHTDILFIDSDLSWSAPDLLKILSYDMPFVAGVYQRKSLSKLDFTVKFGASITLDPHGLIEAERTGTGFMRLRRDCLAAMVSAYPQLKLKDPATPPSDWLYALFDTSIANGQYLGEDFTFCDRWRAVGGKVMIDPQINFAHIGTKAFDEPLMNFLKQN
jgi:hypothetical protein